MTIIDYLLIGVFGALTIYTVQRLFLGWRNSTFRQDEREKSGKLSGLDDEQPGRRVATRAPWTRRAEAGN